MDNFGTMIALFAASHLRPRRVVAGCVGASWIVAGLAWGASKAFEFLPASYLGFAGVVPLGLGIQRAWELRRWRPDIAPVPKGTGIAAAALVTLAQSADNMVVYLSLFADTANKLDAVLFTTFAVCATAWCALALWIARHSPVAGILRRVMVLAVPFLLIAVGVYVLRDTMTDVLAR
jgi:cadmium resistance protein CadD (predicted permease)